MSIWSLYLKSKLHEINYSYEARSSHQKILVDDKIDVKSWVGVKPTTEGIFPFTFNIGEHKLLMDMEEHDDGLVVP